MGRYVPLAGLIGLMILLQSVVEYSASHQALLRLQLDLGMAEPWRWLSGHLIHANWQHLLVNLGSLVAAVLLLPQLLPAARLFPAVLVSCLGVSLGLLWQPQPFHWYVGFSGSLYGLLALGALLGSRHNTMALPVAFFVLGKLLWEQYVGAVGLGEQLFDGQVAIQAHLYGAITGVVAAAAVYLARRLNERQATSG